VDISCDNVSYQLKLLRNDDIQPSSAREIMASSSNIEHHKLTRFFFTISVFITATSVLAVYTTLMTTHYGIKKDDI